MNKLSIKSNQNNIIRVKKPLYTKEIKGTKNIYLDETELFQININNKNLFELKVTSKLEFKFISPVLNDRTRSFFFDYSSLPLDINNQIIDAIILQHDEFYIVVEINFISDILIKKSEISTNEFFVTINNTEGLYFNFNYYNTMSKYIKYKNKDIISNRISDNDSFPGIGIVFDMEKTLINDIDFSRIINFFNSKRIFFIIKNWENFTDLQKKTSKIKDFESFLEKMKINNIDYILQCSNYNNKDGNPYLLMLRDGQIYSDNEKVFLDYFNGEGLNKLFDAFYNIVSLKSKGVYFEPFNFSISDNAIYERIIVNKNNIYQELKLNVKTGIDILNEMISKFDSDFILFSNIPLKNARSIFVREINDYNEKLFTDLEQYYLQYYPDISIYINMLNIEKNSVNEITILFLQMIIQKLFIIDFNLIYYLIKNDNLNKLFFYTIEYRQSLKIFIDNVYRDYCNNGKLPFKNVFYDNKLKGFIFGNELYFAVINGNFINQFFYFPYDQPYYCLNSNKILNSQGVFSYTAGKEYFLIFQKTNTIVPLNIEKNILNVSCPQTIKFSIFADKNLNGSISEIIENKNISIEIIHKINVKFLKNKILINYFCGQKENISRFIIIHFVILKQINKVYCDKKRIAIKKSSDDYFEVEILNKTNNFEITIE